MLLLIGMICGIVHSSMVYSLFVALDDFLFVVGLMQLFRFLARRSGGILGLFWLVRLGFL